MQPPPSGARQGHPCGFLNCCVFSLFTVLRFAMTSEMIVKVGRVIAMGRTRDCAAVVLKGPGYYEDKNMMRDSLFTLQLKRLL